MLTIERFDHIGQVVPDLDSQVTLLEGLFGFTTVQGWEGADGRGARLEIPGADIAWEVLEPPDGDSPLQAYIDSPRGPGVHHVGVAVPDTGAALAALRDAGTKPSEQGGAIDAWMNPDGREGLTWRFFAGDSPCGSGPAVGGGGASAPTLGIKGIDHICQAFGDRDRLARWYEGLLGTKEIWRTPDGEHEDLADLVMETPGGQLLWEVIMPVGNESFIERFVETRGPSAHHVTFEVADWAAAMAACDHHEVPTFDPNDGETDGAPWHDAFIHPKHTGGMLVQLFWEQKPDVWVRSDKVRPGEG